MQTPLPLDQLLGSWTLLSAEQVLPSGETIYPFGDKPSGMLLYQKDGSMSAQVSVRNPSRFADNDLRKVPIEEAAAAWRNYLGYWGSYQIDAVRSIVIHRVQGSPFANWIGTEQVRNFRFEGPDRLILSAEYDEGHYTLTWQRKSA